MDQREKHKPFNSAKLFRFIFYYFEQLTNLLLSQSPTQVLLSTLLIDEPCQEWGLLQTWTHCFKYISISILPDQFKSLVRIFFQSNDNEIQVNNECIWNIN